FLQYGHKFQVKQCHQELEKTRKFLRQVEHELVVSQYERQVRHIQAILSKQNSIETFDFASNEINSSIYSSTPIPITRCNGTQILPITSAYSNGASYSHSNDIINNNNNNNSSYGMAPLNYLSNGKDVCEGPEFHNITTVTMPQLGSFFSLIVINHGLPLCSICDRMFAEVERIIFLINSTELTYTEQMLHQFVVAHIPTVKTICSSLIPACYHNYETNGLNL
uniref:DH domain-containing protein n=1 Tax=Elaeophora elaphi TaxID=1147741 RepID=A0A0R3RZQ7_9BILA